MNTDKLIPKPKMTKALDMSIRDKLFWCADFFWFSIKHWATFGCNKK